MLPTLPKPACPVRESPEADVAVLELTEDPPPAAAPVALKEGSDLWGHSFRAFGFPEGHPTALGASGVIRGPDARGWLRDRGPEGGRLPGPARLQREPRLGRRAG
ncbi:MAG: hypothetical protein RMK65_03085, partial [Anaerolineae bacterium]|nr:hypothetical protein [Anaerolineae bacterium]